MVTAPHLCEHTINTLRVLAIDAIERANSGHPGLPLGAAPMAYALFQNHLLVDGQHPRWPNRDRFVLSAGHGSMLLYGLLHLYGFDVSLQDLQNFRAMGSRTPGHPEVGITAGVEATTGPLGQGAANTVGMAMAERAMAHRFNRPNHTLIDHRTFALLSDGDMMEGVVHEAASLAGHLKLHRLTWLYDANAVTLDGPSHLTDSEDVQKRFEAYGWQVLRIAHGDHDVSAIEQALAQAKQSDFAPTLIIVHTTIGFGAPKKQGSNKSHGSPLGADEARAARAALGFKDVAPFYVPHAVAEHVASAKQRQREAYARWLSAAKAYAEAYPELYRAFTQELNQELPMGWDEDLNALSCQEAMSTRQASGRALNALAQRLPNLLGGDGDLSVSTLTALGGSEDFNGRTGAGRNMRFGVREHAMAAAINGMAYHGGLRPYAATFFVFSDYMRPSLRMAALSRLPVLWVFTHDSLGVGEDGPTHQPIEQLMALRVMPNVTVMRPADVRETQLLYRAVFAQKSAGPIAMVLSRQKLPSLHSYASVQKGCARGAYVLSAAASQDAASEHGILIATGSEVHEALGAQLLLQQRHGLGVRVVSMPSWEIFMQQSAQYQHEVLPAALTARISIEAGATLGWQKWLGPRGVAIGVDCFGASGPGEKILSSHGFCAEHIARVYLDTFAPASCELSHH